MKMPHIGSEKYTLPSAGLTAPSFGLFSRLPWKLSAKTVALSMAAPRAAASAAAYTAKIKATS